MGFYFCGMGYITNKKPGSEIGMEYDIIFIYIYIIIFIGLYLQ